MLLLTNPSLGVAAEQSPLAPRESSAGARSRPGPACEPQPANERAKTNENASGDRERMVVCCVEKQTLRRAAACSGGTLSPRIAAKSQINGCDSHLHGSGGRWVF